MMMYIDEIGCFYYKLQRKSPVGVYDYIRYYSDGEIRYARVFGLSHANIIVGIQE